jgi:hypothetical protein
LNGWGPWGPWASGTASPQEVFSALRDMLYERPALGTLPRHELAAGLYVLGYLDHVPDEGAVEGALEALEGLEVGEIRPDAQGYCYEEKEGA